MMKRIYHLLAILLMQLLTSGSLLYSAHEIPADHPYIQYFGRWDFSNPLAPSHSWPGVYIYAEFEGTSIGVKLADNYAYYNVFIDGSLTKIFKGDKSGVASYTLAAGLVDGNHSILFSKRCETTWTRFSFHGFILDDGKNLLPPPERPARKIEFIGDSFTSASGNEYTEPGKPPDVAVCTNIYEGFGPIIARHYQAQYHATSISGWGMVLDWLGDRTKNIPDSFDQTHLFTVLPQWDFESWIPNLVVIGLGLNDYSGFGGWSGGLTQDETDLYKSRYHEFLQTIRDVYPGAKILAVAAHVPWMQETISKIVEEENASGHEDVFYAFYPYYEGGYVNEGHPNVATHYKIADELIAAIDGMNAWEPYDDKVPPAFTRLPECPFTVYGTSYALEVETDTYASVRFSSEDKPYPEMEHEFTTTGKRKHSVTIPCSHNQHYTYYLRAADRAGNMMDTSAVISFDVDTTKSLHNWRELKFNDADWKKGVAPLGFGSGGAEATIIAPVPTAYFRHEFEVTDASSITYLAVILRYDNGAVIYLNGEEVGRVNLPDGEINYETSATDATSGFKAVNLDAKAIGLIRNGRNMLAVDVHQHPADSLDLLFDLKLINPGILIDLGSTWSYDDAGKQPEDKLISTHIERARFDLPNEFVLYQNYPNPFNPITTISFRISEKSYTTLAVFDLLGRKVKTLIQGELNGGAYQLKFDGSSLPSGEYFCRLHSGNFMEAKKLILLR